MKRLLLMILLIGLTATSCKTVEYVPVSPEIPTLETVIPDKPILKHVETTSDLIENFNTVVGYCEELEVYIEDMREYIENINIILTGED